VPSAFTLVSFSAYSSTLKMEAIYSFETSLTFNGLYGVISQKIVLLNKQKNIFKRQEAIVLSSSEYVNLIKQEEAETGNKIASKNSLKCLCLVYKEKYL
jgi:hypothetical protein